MKKYRAATIQEAIQLAKAELGPDALIMEVRRVVGGTGQNGRGGDVEIVAASETEQAPADSFRWSEPQELPNIEALSRGHTHGYADATYDAAAEYAGQGYGYGSGGLASDPYEIVQCLESVGLRSPLTEEIASTCLAPVSGGARDAAIARSLELAGITGEHSQYVSGRRVIALVGPSGAGKTTTIAKLAAVLSKVQGKRVALITTDTYRVGAVAQLSTFADIMQAPFYSAYNRDDLQDALEETADFDVVFIDTPGANPHNGAMLKELRDLIGSRDPIDCYLTVAMTGDFTDLLHAAQGYSLLNPTGLIVTKMDETVRGPMVAGLAQQMNLPLTYICAGPEVPDHITLATPELLTSLLVQVLDRAGVS
jgi:flagellar biosynthesis protein FlhF